MGVPHELPPIASPLAVPLMTREAFAASVGIELNVFVRQCQRGYWPEITVGKRVFVNVEAIRLLAAERAREFTL